MTQTVSNIHNLEELQEQFKEFITDIWTIECCIPKNWKNPPSTFGVDGVELVGDPYMMLRDHIKRTWINPGRVLGTNFKKVNDIVDSYRTLGIDLNEGEVIYVDDETDDRVNGDHRLEADEICNIPGHMIQRVKFRDLEAKILFANASNVITELPHTNPSVGDIEQSTREIVKATGIYTEDKVRTSVNIMGKHFTPKQRDRIVDTLLVEFTLSNKVINGNRFITISGRRAVAILDKIERTDNPWVEDIWENDDEFSLYINSGQFESRVGGILNANRQAIQLNKPLHIAFSVAPPEGQKNTLNSNRNAFWTTQMQSIEDRVMEAMGIQPSFGRRLFSWNHPDARHMTFAQESGVEDIHKLISWSGRNRGFN